MLLVVAVLGRPMPLVGQFVLRAAGGTVNSGSGPPKTGLIIGVQLESTQSRTLEFILQGPPAWNNGNPHVIRASPTTRSWSGDIDAPALSGTYTLRLMLDGSEASTSFEVDASQVLPRPELQVLREGPGHIVLTWSSVRGALSYRPLVVGLIGSVVHGGEPTRALTQAFRGLSSTGPHLVIVSAYSIDLTPSTPQIPRQFNTSSTSGMINLP